MRPPAPVAIAALVCLALAGSSAVAAEPTPRVVSLNPSLTAILLAIGAEAALVGVDDWSARDVPAVRDLPRVGGLFNPSVEGILALEPDLVVWVPSASQRDLRERLEALGVDVLELRNIRLEEVLASIATLGERVGRADEAAERIAAIRRAWRRVQAESHPRARVRTVLVLQRDPLYVVGSGSFLDEMLRVAGAENVASEFDEPYPRVGVEWLIATGPELILDAAPDPDAAASHWARWPSLLASASAGVVQVPADRVTLPGPQLDEALAWIDRAIGAAVEARRRAATP